MNHYLRWPLRLSLFVLATLLFVTSCQKDELEDFDSSSMTHELSQEENNFFSFDYMEMENSNLLQQQNATLRSGENDEILTEINNDIQAQNQEHDFVQDLVLEYGFPLWNRAKVDQNAGHFEYITVIPFAKGTSTSTTATLYASKKNGKLRYRLLGKKELDQIAQNVINNYSNSSTSTGSNTTTSSGTLWGSISTTNSTTSGGSWGSLSTTTTSNSYEESNTSSFESSKTSGGSRVAINAGTGTTSGVNEIESGGGTTETSYLSREEFVEKSIHPLFSAVGYAFDKEVFGYENEPLAAAVGVVSRSGGTPDSPGSLFTDCELIEICETSLINVIITPPGGPYVYDPNPGETEIEVTSEVKCFFTEECDFNVRPIGGGDDWWYNDGNTGNTRNQWDASDRFNDKLNSCGNMGGFPDIEGLNTPLDQFCENIAMIDQCDVWLSDFPYLLEIFDGQGTLGDVREYMCSSSEQDRGNRDRDLIDYGKFLASGQYMSFENFLKLAAFKEKNNIELDLNELASQIIESCGYGALGDPVKGTPALSFDEPVSDCLIDVLVDHGPEMTDEEFEEILCPAGYEEIINSPVRFGLAAYRVGKKAYSIYKKLKKITPFPKNRFKNELKNASLDELYDIADKLLTIFDANTSGWVRVINVIELVSGLPLSKQNSIINKVSSWGNGAKNGSYRGWFTKNNQPAGYYVGKGDQGRMRRSLAQRAKNNNSHLSKSEWKGAFLNSDIDGSDIGRAAEKEEAVEMFIDGWRNPSSTTPFYNSNNSPGINKINADGF